MSLSTSRFYFVSVLILGIAVSIFGQPVTATTPITLDSKSIRHQISPQGTTQPVTFTGLVVGEAYHLTIPVPTEMAGCQPTVYLAGSLNPASSTEHELSFMSMASQMTVILEYPCSWDTDNAPYHYISLVCRSCMSDIKPTDKPEEVISIGSIDPFDAVKDVLIGGNCFDISGVNFCGSGSQLGTFSGGQTSIGFAEGIIIATGPATIAIGPNDSDGAGGGAGCTGDSDLQGVASGTVQDVGKLEFDFTPTQTPVVFQYVFASEEYCEYVNSQFNDVFGFFLSGPGVPGGTQNIAQLPPPLSVPVTINNVNHLTNTGFYVNNQPASSGNLCGQAASTLPATTEIQYDGYTRKLTAVANVIPCQTYHIKLAVGDVGDGAWDSAVFLKAGSFDAGGNASVEWVVNGSTDIDETYEKCGQVQLLFDRVGGNLNVPVSVQFTITGTATPGVDYAPIPGSVIIPAGQDQVLLTVNIFSDLLIEGQETIIITLNNPCSCTMPQEILYINDLPPLTTEPDSVFVCGPTGNAVLEATYEGGVEPYTFQWSNNGGTNETFPVYVAASNTYKVTITDACGQTAVKNIRVQVLPPPKAQIIPPAPQLCPDGGSGFLTVNFTGTGPFELNYSINGNPEPTIYDITANPYLLEIFEVGTYTINSVVDYAGCQGPGLGAVLVVQSTLNLTGVVSNVQCFGQANGSINTTVTGGQAPFTYNWTGPQTVLGVADPSNLMAGTYEVTLTDAFHCTVTNTFQVQAASVIQPSIAGVQGPNCFNPLGGSINLEVSGGFPGYTYKWSNTATVQDPQNLAAGTYTVTITDAGGCTRSISATVIGNFTPPVAVAAPLDELDCQTLTVNISGQGSSVGPTYSYLWTAVGPGNITAPNNTLTATVTQGGTYQIKVTNSQNGCTSTANVTVISNILPPIAEAGQPQVLTCAVTNVTLNGNGSSSGNNNFAYLWTASNGGTIAGGANTLQPIVSSTGTYTLQVTNLTNFCTSTDNVDVTANTIPPTANIAQAGQINCTQTTVTLNAAGSVPSNVVYNWVSLNGNIISGNDSPNPVVSEAGDYTVIVTNPQNGCTDDATIVVTVNTAAPAAIAIVNGELNCITSQLVINGSNSSNTGNFSWTAAQGGNIVSGANTLTPTVNKPGLYTLQVTNPANNCSASASVQVTENIIPPVAVAGPPATLNCYNPTLVVGDTNTFILPGTVYQWTLSNGAQIMGSSTQPAATATTAGTYTLLVTNQINGCTNSASVAIPQDKIAPVAVVAPAGQINCTTPFIQLNGIGSSTGPIYTYQWSSSNGIISAGPTTLTPAISADGIYLLVVTNNVNGCTSTANATVTANLNLPNVTIAAANPITCNISQIGLNATGTSTGGNFGYQWGTINGLIISGANSLTPTVGAPGTYTLIVTNNTNNCTATENVVVPANNIPPMANAGPTQVLDCNVPSIALNGSASAGAQFQYFWSSTDGGNILIGANTLSPIIDAPGTYALLVTNNQTGCTNVAAVQITKDAGEPIIQIAAPAKLTCAVMEIGLNAAGSSSGTNFTYSWTGPGIVNGASSPSPTVNVSGIYTLEITNTDNGCTTLETVTVPKDVTPPVADAGPDNTLNCYQPQFQIGSTTMSTGPDFTYNWAGQGIVSGANSAAPVINLPGTYSVTVTNVVNGCTTTDILQLDANFTTPQVNAGPDFVLTCTENFYQTNPSLTGTGPFSYHWATNGGNFLNDPDQFSPIVNGVGFYYITVTNTISGCTTSDQIQVSQSSDFPTAAAGLSGVLTCVVTDLMLDGSGSSQGDQFQYQWIPVSGGNIISGANTLSPVINEPGTYSLAVRDSTNSCISYSSVIITENIEKPDIDAGAPVTLTCSTSFLTLQGDINSNGSFSSIWIASNGGNILSGNTTLSPLINAVGTYTLTVTSNLNGCTSTDTASVLADQNAPVVAIAEPDTLSCIFSAIILDATGSTTGNVAYTWSTSNGNIIDQSNPSKVKVDAPGLYQLLIVNLDNNCASLAAVNVAENTVKPIANAGENGELNCVTILSTLNGAGSSTTGNYFYQWSTPNGEILAGANTLSPAVIAAGTYLLTVLNTDNGCSSSDQTVVNQDIMQPEILIVIPALITCFSPEVVLDGSNSDNGSDHSFAWTTPNGNIISGEDALQAVVNAPGSYTLTVLNNENGCANASTTLVEQNTVAPSVQILPPDVLNCSVPEVAISALAENGTQYVFGWSTINGHIVSGAATLNLRVDEPGTYSILIVNNLNGCASLANTNVLEITNHPTDFDYTLKLPGCRDNDGSIRFDTVVGGIGPYLYSLDGGSTYSTTIAFGSVAPGNYELLIQDINGCEYAEDLEIPKAIDPAVDLIPQFYLSLGDSLQIKAELPPGFPLNLIDSITWTPLDYLTFEGNSIQDLLNPRCKPLHTVKYEVKISTKNGGCEASDRVLIIVDSEPKIYIPNVFWPDDPSQENGLVMIFADDLREQIKQVNTFQIFDRWGDMVHQAVNFKPNDPAYGWNGRINGTGNVLTPAVFVYYAVVELIDGRIILYEGDVTLVR